MRYFGISVGAGLLATGLVGYLIGQLTNFNLKGPVLTNISATASNAQLDIIRLGTALDNIEKRLELVEARQSDPAQNHLAAPGPSVEPDNAIDPESAIDNETRKSAEIERRLTRESRDRSWAMATEEQIQKSVELTGKGRKAYTINKLSCLTSLCTLELTTSSPASGFEMMHGLAINVTGMAGFQSAQPEKSADGLYQLSYKFFRAGYPLPGEVHPL